MLLLRKHARPFAAWKTAHWLMFNATRWKVRRHRIHILSLPLSLLFFFFFTISVLSNLSFLTVHFIIISFKLRVICEIFFSVNCHTVCLHVKFLHRGKRPTLWGKLNYLLIRASQGCKLYSQDDCEIADRSLSQLCVFHAARSENRKNIFNVIYLHYLAS